jgi:hypothetical protein
MTRGTESSGLRRFVERHQNAVGFALAGLVLATLAFDYFVVLVGRI